MNTLRRTFFFLLALFLFAGAYQASAQPVLSFIQISPINLTTGIIANGGSDTRVDLAFNFTNATDAVGGIDIGDLNISNLTIAAILPNGTEVQVYKDISTWYNYINDSGIFMFSATPTIFLNSTFIPQDQEGTLTLNITAELYNATDIAAAQFTFNSSEIFLGFSLGLDLSGPNVALKFYDRLDNEQTQFEATDLVKITCTRSATGASYNNTNLTMQSPGGGNFDDIDADLSRDTVEKDFTVEFTETRELGDYTVACNSIDDTGNINDTVNATFTIVSKPPRSTSAFKNKEFQRPTGQKIVSESEDLGKVTETGDSRLMRKGASVKVDVKGETHTITVKDLTPATLTLTIASTPQELTINKGETKDVDVDGDGQNDLAITYHQQYKSGSSATADVTLKSTATAAEPKKETNTQPNTPTTEAQPTTGSSSGTAVVIVIVIIAVIVIGFALLRGKKR